MHTKFWLENLMGRNQLGDKNANGIQFKETVCYREDRIQLAHNQSQMVFFCQHNSEPSGSIKV
jgi:hypothetical protein